MAEESLQTRENHARYVPFWHLIAAHDMEAAMLKLHTVPKGEKP